MRGGTREFIENPCAVEGHRAVLLRQFFAVGTRHDRHVQVTRRGCGEQTLQDDLTRCVIEQIGATHDIGLSGNSRGAYDTPSLLRISESAPYLHDGRAATLEEIFTKHNPSKLHGNAADLNAEQISDLVEFLKSL